MAKRKKQNDAQGDSGSARSNSNSTQNTQSNAATPSPSTPKPKKAQSRTKIGTKLQIAYDCNLGDKPYCNTVETMALVCSQILAEYINLDTNLQMETNNQLV